MKRIGAFVLVGVACLSLRAVAQETLLKGQVLADALRRGGHVILLRHAAGDKSQKDAEKVSLNDCNTQRNLSREGRIEARMIGQGIDTLQIPVSRVLSSPFCRAMDTARLAFSRVESSSALNYVSDTDAEKKKAAALLKPLLATAPRVGSNTVLVSHSTNILATIGFAPSEGEAVVFKPDGKGSYQIVGRIQAKDWSQLQP